MTAVQPREADHNLVAWQRIQLPEEAGIVVVRGIEARPDGLDLFVANDAAASEVRVVPLTSAQAEQVKVVTEDGAARPEVVLAGLWNEWMLGAVRSARSTVLASTTLKPYPHQMDAVYGHMLTQPLLRFLLADEPGTGKTIMSGLWLREAQRLGLVRRALVVCPAHLVIKWKADFERFFAADLREVTAETIRQRALAGSDDDLWVVSLNLAAMNKPLRDALHPDEAGWDAVIFDEAHRMTPTAETFHRVGKELSGSVPHAVFLTATPHRGDEWYFRELLHLVDPDVFPTSGDPDSGLPKLRRSDKKEARRTTPLTPGPLHFLRRMKEELVDYDTESLLFKEREAVNVKVRMNPTEQRFYDRALELVLTYFPARGRALAAMVYGKRAASSLYALAQTLRRRFDKMGTGEDAAAEPGDGADEDDDRAEERVTAAASLDARAEKQAINEVLAELDPLVDPDRLALDELNVSKWAPMIDCLTENGISPGSGRQIVVFTEYADTADWLVRAFNDAGFAAECYSGTDDHTERAAIQARFMDGRFEVIVSTDAGNEGIDLQVANLLVNWDIPWSLVRLEQRMGRIHRIGQQHKVMLYNMVALGTCEGDAHERLLDRLIEAANELGGQMFDSINAIMERVESGTPRGDCESLLRLFYDAGPTRASGGDWPSLEEIRRVRDEYFAELRALSSEVDPAAANAARHDDHLARINPIIVERYLTRIANGNLLQCDPAPLGDDGFFYLSASPGVRGWQLPASLRLSNGRTVVATRADARQQAIDDGVDRAAETIMLGPSDPPLTTLATALRERVEPEMWQGAVLSDRSAREDYTLFVYECGITEGSEGRNPKHRQRGGTLSWLIRVSASGEARTVPWDTLPNLAPAEDLVPVPLAAGDAEAARRQAIEAAERERSRRAQRLDSWVKQLKKELRRLPNALTDPIPDRETKLAQRDKIRATITARLEEAERVAQVTCGEPRRIGWAHVVAVHDETASDADPESEAVSMRLVTNLFTGQGWRVADVHTEGGGYDLYAERGAEQRCVEVKGLAGSAASAGVRLTGGELAKAAQLGDEYWLYVVENCVDGEGRLYAAWQNPAETFRDSFTDVPVVRLSGSRLKAALPTREA
ncbi:MAG: DUF3883 domain-containing protein [Acidimicrobiaceae bacterium]|nr:DUF3883 domain-containing protein [Acidimicrobiaceae bacterium]MYE08895.1 DUF3883 domain-containing protein [Acidimicrobiaceae bacterium]MYI35982.1 DUF3883 domain-containing protein [Acidimicrobiaceae bacterium]